MFALFKDAEQLVVDVGADERAGVGGVWTGVGEGGDDPEGSFEEVWDGEHGGVEVGMGWSGI